MAVTPSFVFNTSKVMKTNDILRRQQQLWYPMRITYGRAERMERFQRLLDAENIQNFMVWRDELQRTDQWDVRKERVPAVNGLIFLHASQETITNLKMTRREFEPMHYYTNRLTDRLSGETAFRPLTIPDGQMQNFMNIYNRQDDKIALLEYTDFIAKPGKRVRVTQGDFEGTVGTIKRIKKSQCVVVQLEGFAAIALAFVPPSWLEELSEADYRKLMDT